MKHISKLILLISFFAIYSRGYSQGHFCAQSICYDEMTAQDPSLQSIIDLEEEELQNMIGQMKISSSSQDVITIPTVVHIIHLGQTDNTNIPYDQVVSAIDALNDDFRKEAGTQGDGNGVDTYIEFCLANRRDDGSPFPNPLEPGVVRIDASSTVGAEGAYSSIGVLPNSNIESVVKSLSYENQEHYYNIWVVNKITNPNPNGSTIFGFSYFANTTLPELQGTVVSYDRFGLPGSNSNASSASFNRVLTHETGHFLNLYHTFEDGDETNCPPPGSLGDRVADTPPHKASPSNTCNTQANNSCIFPNGQLGDIVKNYMDVSAEDCRNIFTAGQSERMNATIMAQRDGLINSIGCMPPCNLAIDFTHEPEVDIFDGDIAYFTNLSTQGTIFTWYVNGLEIFTGTNFFYEFTEPGNYNVCLRAESSTCIDQICKVITVFDSDLCYDVDLPICEHLINGNFEQVNPSILELDLPTYPNEQDFNILCRWVNYEGTPQIVNYSSPIPSENNTVILYKEDTGNHEILGTTDVSPFSVLPNTEYILELDYYLLGFLGTNQCIDRVEIGLSNGTSVNASSQVIAEFIPIFDGTSFITTATDLAPFAANSFLDSKYHTVSLCCTTPPTVTVGQYLYIETIFSEKSACGDKSNIFFFDNVNLKIKDCNQCLPLPNIGYNTTDGCTYNFSGSNSGSQGDYNWTIDGAPPFNDQQNITYEFPFPGVFDVCLSINCDDINTETICKQIDVTDQDCGDCTEVYSPPGGRCPDEGKTYFHIHTTVSSDLDICDEELFVYSPNFDIEVTSLIIGVNSSDPTKKNLSFTFETDGDLPSSDSDYLIYYTLCDEMGGVHCFYSILETNECDSCEELEGSFIATCDPNFTFNNGSSYPPEVNVYTVQINLPGFSPQAVFDIESDHYVIHLISVSPTDNTLGLVIPTLNDLPFSVSGIIEVYDQGDLFCYPFNIIIPEPCEDAPEDCEREWNGKKFECKDDRGDGLLVFSTGDMVIDQVPAGYHLCDESLMVIPEVGLPTVNNGVIIGSDLHFNIDILVDPNDLTDDVFELELILCDDAGRVICYLINFDIRDLDCLDKRSSRPFVQLGPTDQFISVYPNPASSELNVKINKEEADALHSINIMNTVGSVIYRKDFSSDTDIKINTSNIPAGIYFISITDENLDVTIKKVTIMK